MIARTDNDRMPFGTHDDKKMKDVPLKYWRWFIDRDWAQQWPTVFDYALSKLKEVMPQREALPGERVTADGRILRDRRTVAFKG